MTVQVYGRLSDAIGRRLEIQAPEGCSIAGLRDDLHHMHPNAARSNLSSTIIANVVLGKDHRLAAADEVELLPPVSGR